MEKTKEHYHPLNPTEVCCAAHACELISIYIRQKKEQDVLSLLLYYSENLETKFILDKSEEGVSLKLKLGKFYNKFALVRGLDIATMKQLLETAYDIYSSLPESKENLGYLATANSNLAFVARSEGDLEKSCKYLDQVSSLERKIGDSTGDVMTKINKSAVLNEMEAYREAYYTIKEAVSKLEKKIEEFIKSHEEKNLKNNKKFSETLQLLLISYINLISSLENIEDPALFSEGKQKKALGFEYCLKYLGENHYLSMYFKKNQSKHTKSMSSFSSNLDLGSNRTSSHGVNEKKSYKDDDESKMKNHAKAPVKKKLQDTPTKEVLRPEKEAVESSKPSQMNSREILDLPNSGIPSPKFVGKDTESFEFVRRKYSRNSFKSSEGKNTSDSRLIIKNDSFSQSESSNKLDNIEGKARIVRLPGAPLPYIPARSCLLRAPYKYSFKTAVVSKGTEFLLDPIKSPIISQLDSNIGYVKVFNSLNRVIICNLQLDSNIVNLAITATSEGNFDQVLTSEFIKIKDLQTILYYLCVQDILPSYMQATFINSFEKFCQFFLMPFIRIVQMEDSSTEKIELWARGESLLGDTTQTFLKTACTISLFYIENFTLKMVITSTTEEESTDKCIRVDIVLDEVAANALIKHKKIPEAYQNTHFVQSIEPFSATFIEDLDSIISEIELCIIDEFGPRITLDRFFDNNNFILIRANITGKGLEKTLWTIQDRKQKWHWEVKAKRLHKINSSGRKRNFSTTFIYNYSMIFSNFGVYVDKLDKNELQILGFFVLESMRIDMPLEEDLNELENEGSILISPVKALKGMRSFAKDEYRTPISVAIVGVGNWLIGVRASYFDIEQCCEKAVWFILDGKFYRLECPKFKKAEKAKGVLAVKLAETKLVEIMEKGKGWEKVLGCLKVDKNGIRIQSFGTLCYFESLENVINKQI